MNKKETAAKVEPACHWINGEWISSSTVAHSISPSTKDIDRAQRVAHAIKAGTVWINTWGLINDAFEEGGFTYSGIGRARGARAMEEFQEVKTQIRLVAPESASRPNT
jgi:acyl-CoA reductase-like NAD-dependent aldehyde dehydrogenase